MPKEENVPDNTLKSLRSVLFRELQDLRNGDQDAQHAIAVSKIAGKVIDSYALEISAVKTANELKDKNISYAATLAGVITPDTAKVIEEKKDV